MRRFLAVTMGLVGLALVEGACFSDGGCYEQQSNFQVQPPESCLQMEPDVCEAQGDQLTITNHCSGDLVVDYGSVDASVPGEDGGPTTRSVVAPGTKGSIFVRPFEQGSGQSYHVSIPAQLGGVAVVLSYDVSPT